MVPRRGTRRRQRSSARERDGASGTTSSSGEGYEFGTADIVPGFRVTRVVRMTREDPESSAFPDGNDGPRRVLASFDTLRHRANLRCVHSRGPGDSAAARTARRFPAHGNEDERRTLLILRPGHIRTNSPESPSTGRGHIGGRACPGSPPRHRKNNTGPGKSPRRPGVLRSAEPRFRGRRRIPERLSHEEERAANGSPRSASGRLDGPGGSAIRFDFQKT